MIDGAGWHENLVQTIPLTFGTPMYRLHNAPTEVARTLLVVMRRGSPSAAEEITGHKHETIGRWLRAAAQHAEQITEVLVRNLHLMVVKVDAFWSFVKKICPAQRRPAETEPRWGCLIPIAKPKFTKNSS